MAIIFKSATAKGFCTDRFTTAAGTGGYLWTLTQRLGVYLREAERRYGERDMQWTILGIEYSGDVPHVWFPLNEKLISIMLTDSAAMEPNQALFQLAHEVIHLLKPSRITPTTVFEEGLATLFAHDMSALDGLNMRSVQTSYLSAERAVREFLSIYPDGVRELWNSTKRAFTFLTKEEILEACPRVPGPLAVELSSKFNRDALA